MFNDRDWQCCEYLADGRVVVCVLLTRKEAYKEVS